MKKFIPILAILFLAACGGSDNTNSNTKTTSPSNPPTTQGGGAVDEKYEQGKNLFNSKCNVCHELNRKLVGPPLAGIGQKRSADWLHSYIRDNNAVRSSGDTAAIAIFKEYNETVMNTFPDLTDEQIDAIVYYCDTPKK